LCGLVQRGLVQHGLVQTVPQRGLATTVLLHSLTLT